MSAAAGSSFAELLTAWSTLGIGVGGVAVTIWQFRKSGFHPILSSRIDARREACDLRIVNRGRTSGIIGQLLVLRASNSIIQGVKFEGFPGESFRPLVLPALGSMRVVIQAPPKSVLPRDVVLLVDIGAKKPQRVTPVPIDPQLGIYGTQSVLPPSAPTSDVNVPAAAPAQPCPPPREERRLHNLRRKIAGLVVTVRQG
jgi:hypothetical protein